MPVPADVKLEVLVRVVRGGRVPELVYLASNAVVYGKQIAAVHHVVDGSGNLPETVHQLLDSQKDLLAAEFQVKLAQLRVEVSTQPCAVLCHQVLEVVTSFQICFHDRLPFPDNSQQRPLVARPGFDHRQVAGAERQVVHAD